MPPVLEATAFADADRLNLPGRPRVVHVPGHTPGSAAFLFEDRGALCAGDALDTLNPATGRPGPPIGWPRGGSFPVGSGPSRRRSGPSLPIRSDPRRPVPIPGERPGTGERRPAEW